MNRDGPWVALSCGFGRSRKVEGLTRAAPIALYVMCLAHCGDELTDGHVRTAAMPRLLLEAKARRSDVAELERAGLLEPVEGGWLIASYLDWNPSAEWWERQRQNTARRQAEWRKRARNDSETTTERQRDERETTARKPRERQGDPMATGIEAERNALREPSRDASVAGSDETRRESRTSKPKRVEGSTEPGPLADDLAAALARLSPDGVPL